MFTKLAPHLLPAPTSQACRAYTYTAVAALLQCAVLVQGVLHAAYVSVKGDHRPDPPSI